MIFHRKCHGPRGWGFREDEDGFLAFFTGDVTEEPVRIDRHLASLRGITNPADFYSEGFKIRDQAVHPVT